MKKESFEEYIWGYYSLTGFEKMDIKDKYRECFHEEVNKRVNEQLEHAVAQKTMQLENKLHSEILKEEIIKRIDKINSDIEHMKLFMHKAYSPTPRHGSVNIKKTANLPIYDRLWISIRKWQRDTGTSNTELARILGISERTLRDYDKSARTMPLEKLTKFIDYIDGTIEIGY